MITENILKQSIHIMKSIPWVKRSNYEILKMNKQIIYSRSTRTFYPRIKFRYGCNKIIFKNIYTI